MYWPPGHATLPHDHGGFGGIEVVLNGTLHVEEFVRSGSEDVPALVKSRCVYLGIGDVAVFDSQRYVHRCRNLSNTGPTLTLNVYGGALERYTAFETGASGVVRAQPTIALSDGVLETRDGGTRRLRVIYAGETGVLVAETTPTILPLGQHDREVNMVRRTRRWRKPPPKVLSLPTSQRTELCYAFEGKAHHQRPLQGERVELLLIDQERCTRWVNSPARSSLRLPVDEDVDGWRVLGWRLPSGDLRHGDYDVVDPELADFDRLPVPNTKPYLEHSSGNCLAEASPAFRDRD
jgi:hypothetical protein